MPFALAGQNDALVGEEGPVQSGTAPGSGDLQGLGLAALDQNAVMVQALHLEDLTSGLTPLGGVFPFKSSCPTLREGA